VARPHRRRSAKAIRILRKLVITAGPHAYPGVHVLTAKVRGRELGYMEIEEAQTGGHKFFKVAFASTRKTGLGIGTKLYERAARYACRLGAPLASDSSRTRFSQGFWEKQAKKGRAVCVKGSGKATKLTDEFEHKGKWTCGTYALECPAPRSLAAIKKVR
jgi:GNAT superfamily N-acetyltransferase